ncbi:hypothetical protein [Pseudarthrobacter sp. C4D7]|uniref:hypothetical protein n=1 Tax=Pseudarthrobacter sp. C4D7 TaxID=2735268 RepID=UPI001585C470|nr:hypothetical protein [Pseudarthrobacter sp. C4D7]NUT72348.1 hypothetical protein [Pseudarthrobacter sp. C4D7]
MDLTWLITLFSQKDAPWWGVPVIAGIFLMIGASMSFGSAWTVDRIKGNRELARRFDADIKAYGAEFLQSCDRYQKALQKLVRSKPAGFMKEIQHDDENTYGPSDSPEYKAMLGVRDKAQESADLLSFVAPDSLTSAARDLQAELLAAQIFHAADTDDNKAKVAAARLLVVNEVRKAIELPESAIGKSKKKAKNRMLTKTK